MDRTATIELTNLCLICQGDKILVQERTWNGEKGLIFPGGHVEKDESILASVIRGARASKAPRKMPGKARTLLSWLG